jgi:polyribonucleotide nucleotidyltransferase
LMDAGVPISAPVAGVAMGLIIEKEKTVILTDIAGIEDFNGDMDFKVAGTEKGITALQLDVKTLSLTLPILKKALAQAKEARGEVMKVVLATINEPRKEVSEHAPKVRTIKIKVDKIGEVIGPGGKTIKKIIAETGAEVEVEDDGTVNISGIGAVGVEKAVAWVESLVREVAPGEIYTGTVTRLMNFGAFVEVLPGKEGLVHVSDMSTEFVKDPGEVVKVGQQVEVRVKEIDEMGRINLTMILDPGKAREKRASSYPRREARSRNDWNRRERRDERRVPRKDFGESSGQRSGPHFPASRLLTNEKKDFG